MNIETVGHFLVDPDEELLELGCPVTSVQRADHLARCHVQCGEQARGPMA